MWRLNCVCFNNSVTVWYKIGVYEKKRAILSICLVVIFIYVCYSIILVEDDDYLKKGYSERPTSYETENQKYLISTSKCRIPDIDPFNDEIRKYIFKEKYSKCTKLGLLTYIEKTDGVAVLKINASLLHLYSSLRITCCYSKIFRTNYLNTSDNEIIFSACKTFHNKVAISYPYIRVSCSTVFSEVYANTHATVIDKTGTSTKRDKNRYSVLLVGIDSISKLNLRRTLPKTYSYLEKNFISLKGYNKIGDNTFPNLMAILTGQNLTQLEVSCSTKVKLNNCDMVWKTFKKLGYATAYAEDEVGITTFNYDRPGFLDPPTDYYYRPYIVASEKLGKKFRYGMTFCAGPENSGERIFNLARDFSVSFTRVPSFGLFWTNSFSHDNINLPSAMDEKVVEFLSDISFKASLNETIMIFFSDHGFRFGDIRYTHTGWLEERLPFMYFYIPNSFRTTFPKEFHNFLVNTERLTTPYDVYTTLEHLLKIGNKTYRAKRSLGCPNCHSLFEVMAETRTCKEAAIDQHWCTCTGHNYINPNDDLVKLVAEFVVKEINTYIDTFAEGKSCADYVMNKVVTAGMSKPYFNENNETVNYFLVIVETTPNAMFEATVEAYLSNDFKLLGDVSRINRYASSSGCVKNAVLKKYCFCDGFLKKIKTFLYNLIYAS